MAKQMTGAEMVVRALKDQGVEVLFGYPGGAVLPIYDAIFHQNKFAMCWCATSRAPPMRLRATPARAARSGCFWSLRVPARPMRSPASPTP